MTEIPNPLAVGVTLGGLLLDVVVPRPKPRAGLPFPHSPWEHVQAEDTVAPGSRHSGERVR